MKPSSIGRVGRASRCFRLSDDALATRADNFINRKAFWQHGTNKAWLQERSFDHDGQNAAIDVDQIDSNQMDF